MRVFTFLIIFTSCLLGVALVSVNADQTAASSDNSISIHSDVNLSTVTIGQIIQCRIAVRYTADVELLSEIPQPEAAGLELRNSSDFQDKEGKSRITGKQYSFVAFKLGNYLIEPIEISFRKKGGAVQTVKSNPVYISVVSVAAGDEKNDIRDVKGVVKLPYLILKYLLPIGLPLLFFGLLAIYLLYFRKKEKSDIRTISRLTPAHEALQNLHELFESSLLREGRIKHYYLRFSEIMRIFLEKQYGINAVEATTSEINRALKNISIAEDSKKHLNAVLEAADFAKFAKWVPAVAEIIALNKQAEAVVVELSGLPEPAGEGTHAVS